MSRARQQPGAGPSPEEVQTHVDFLWLADVAWRYVGMSRPEGWTRNECAAALLGLIAIGCARRLVASIDRLTAALQARIESK